MADIFEINGSILRHMRSPGLFKDISLSERVSIRATQVSNGTEIRLPVPSSDAVIFISGVRVKGLSILDRMATLKEPPAAGSIISMLPTDFINVQLDGDLGETVSINLFTDADERALIISSNSLVVINRDGNIVTNIVSITGGHSQPFDVCDCDVQLIELDVPSPCLELTVVEGVVRATVILDNDDIGGLELYEE